MNGLHAPDQTRAINAAIGWYRRRDRGYFRLEGPAGTGKTSLAWHISDLCAPGSTAYLAPTGKAAAVLRQKDCPGATTIHAAIYAHAGERTAQLRDLRTQYDALPPGDPRRADLEQAIAAVRAQPLFRLRAADKAFAGRPPNLIVLDEASMVDDRTFTDLASFRIPILALGDPHQLPPVGGTAGWLRGRPDAELTTIHRGGDHTPLIDLATALRSGRPAPRWCGVAGATNRPWAPADLLGWDQIVVGRNNTRWAVIGAVRAAEGRTAGVPEPGDRVMVLRNDPEHQVVNGQQGHVLAVQEGDGGWIVTVKTDDGEAVWPVDGRGFEGQAGQDAAKRDRETGLVAATFAQAVTCHAAQGSQWPRVAVVDEAQVFRADASRWRYTAATRAERACVLLNPARMVAPGGLAVAA